MGGDSLPASRRTSILLHCLGAEGQRICASLDTSTSSYSVGSTGEQESDEFTTSMQKLDKRFGPVVNVSVQRRVRARLQLPTESTSEYMGELRCLAVLCNLGTFQGDAIRDQLIEGTTSLQLREIFLMEGSVLTLEEALLTAANYEAGVKAAQAFSATAPVQKLSRAKVTSPNKPP